MCEREREREVGPWGWGIGWVHHAWNKQRHVVQNNMESETIVDNSSLIFFYFLYTYQFYPIIYIYIISLHYTYIMQTY